VRVEILGRIGADRAGDEVALSLSRDGIGHAALLRDPAAATPIGAAAREIPLDRNDVQLGLRYLANFSSVLLLDPADASMIRGVAEGAAFVGAHLIVVGERPLDPDDEPIAGAAAGAAAPPLFIQRPKEESPEFDAVLVALLTTEEESAANG